MVAKNILFLVGDFAEDYEVMMPFQALTARAFPSSWNKTDNSFTEPHVEIASSLRSSQ